MLERRCFLETLILKAVNASSSIPECGVISIGRWALRSPRVKGLSFRKSYGSSIGRPGVHAAQVESIRPELASFQDSHILRRNMAPPGRFPGRAGQDASSNIASSFSRSISGRLRAFREPDSPQTLCPAAMAQRAA